MIITFERTLPAALCSSRFCSVVFAVSAASWKHCPWNKRHHCWKYPYYQYPYYQYPNYQYPYYTYPYYQYYQYPYYQESLSKVLPGCHLPYPQWGSPTPPPKSEQYSSIMVPLYTWNVCMRHRYWNISSSSPKWICKYIWLMVPSCNQYIFIRINDPIEYCGDIIFAWAAKTFSFTFCKRSDIW